MLEVLDRILQDAHKMSQIDFVDSHPHPVLLLEFGVGVMRPASDFRTGEISVVSFRREIHHDTDKLRKDHDDGASLPFTLPRKMRLLKIIKAAGGVWRDRISIGRARNNDLLLMDRSVSKLHAHFALSRPGLVQITDVGSRNGTEVNGVRLIPHTPFPLNSGDAVRFGKLRGIFQLPAGLWQCLRDMDTEDKKAPRQRPGFDLAGDAGL